MPGLGMRAYWSPRTSFPVSGAGGCFYDPNDLSTMFQDVAGTIPCAVDSTVALIKDKGPFGYDASQSDSAKRPTLKKDSATGRHFLRYGPSDQRLVTEAVIPRTTGTMFSAVAVQNISDPANYPIYLSYRGTDYDNESRLPMFVYLGPFSKMAVQFGSSGEVQFTTNRSLKKVFSCTTASGTLTAYDNGSFVGSDSSIANPTSNTLKEATIGANANFDFYGAFILYGFTNSTANRSRIEKWFAERMGLVY